MVHPNRPPHHPHTAWLARVGSGLFLIIQMLILLDCTQAWNDAWVEEEDDRYLYGLLAISVGAYMACVGVVIFLFYWFNPSGVEGGCSTNVVLIMLSILLVVVFSALSLSPHVCGMSFRGCDIYEDAYGCCCTSWRAVFFFISHTYTSIQAQRSHMYDPCVYTHSHTHTLPPLPSRCNQEACSPVR